MRWVGTTAALLLMLTPATGLVAAEPYAFSFSDGQELKYRRALWSDGQMAMPDGSSQPMKMQAVSQVVLKRVGKTADGFSIESQTVRAKATMNGKETPMPKETGGKRTFVLKPSGQIVGESTGLDFGVVFPEKPLAKGDSFTVERSGETVKGPATRTIFTVTDTDGKVGGYSGTVTVFDAKIELLPSAKAKKIVLKNGSGTLWFDRGAGLLVRSKMGLAFDEEMVMPGSNKPQATTFGMHSDWELVTK